MSRPFVRSRLAVLVGVTACASRLPPATPVPALPVDQVALSLYLIGDAGAPDPRGEPVLQALSDELGTRSSERVVVFMGDNAYPRGLPLPGQPDRKEAERRLTAQVEVVTRARVKGYFVPGNHDWARYGKDGWQAIQRQQAFMDSAGGGAVVFLPEGGCPGPSVVDLGRRVRLVLLDTQWWLHHGPKPLDPDSNCPADSEHEVVDSLHQALTGARDRLVVVVAPPPVCVRGRARRPFHLAGSPLPPPGGCALALDPIALDRLPLSSGPSGGYLKPGYSVHCVPASHRGVAPGLLRGGAGSVRGRTRTQLASHR